MKAQPNARTPLREALADELATIRAINGALAVPYTVTSTRNALESARADCLAVVKKLLVQLHPTARAARRAPRKVTK